MVIACVDASAASLKFIENTANNHEYGRQISLPSGFGAGEFTYEVWVRPDNSFPIGTTSQGSSVQLRNWSSEDNQPYSSGSWWWKGNFLLDGHNNNVFENGTFSLQFYGGGRVRWDFGDGTAMPGGHLAVQAWPATNTGSLLDGNWHRISCVRRWSGTSSATLELWVDGTLIDTETSARRTNMWTTYWSSWSGFPSGQSGWFWGSEKQAAIGVLSQYEDFKGLVDETLYWSRAKTTLELQNDWANPVTGSESGLIGWYPANEGAGTSVCNVLTTANCLSLIKTTSSIWNTENAPTGTPPPPSVPNAPTNFTATAASASQVNLSWIDSSNETSYSLERSTDGPNYAVVASVGAGVTSYADTGRTASTIYYYRALASNAAGSSQYSNLASVTTPAAPTTVPTTPMNLAATAVSASQINLSWSDSVNETSYTIDRSTDGASYAVIATLEAGVTSYSDTGRNASTRYYYGVQAHNAAGNSGYSSVVSATTLAPAPTGVPTTPTNLTATAVSPNQINLAWVDSSDETSYTIERSTDGWYYTVIVTLSAGVTSYSDSGLNASTRYYYGVQAHNSVGSSNYSNDAITTTPAATPAADVPAPPTNLTATTFVPREIALSWTDNSDDETGFRIQRSTNGTNWTQIAVASANQTTYNNTGLRSRTTYYYRVRAYNTVGNSTYSNTISARTR